MNRKGVGKYDHGHHEFASAFAGQVNFFQFKAIAFQVLKASLYFPPDGIAGRNASRGFLSGREQINKRFIGICFRVFEYNEGKVFSLQGDALAYCFARFTASQSFLFQGRIALAFGGIDGFFVVFLPQTNDKLYPTILQKAKPIFPAGVAPMYSRSASRVLSRRL